MRECLLKVLTHFGEKVLKELAHNPLADALFGEFFSRRIHGLYISLQRILVFLKGFHLRVSHGEDSSKEGTFAENHIRHID